jgi:hypothetical protein
MTSLPERRLYLAAVVVELGARLGLWRHEADGMWTSSRAGNSPANAAAGRADRRATERAGR